MSPASSDSLTALRALLAQADDLGSLREVAERLVPERRHVLLRRAAIPVVFDEALVRAVLMPRLPATADGATADEDADVAWLLAHSDIERLGGGVLYRMRADVRNARLERWFAPNERARAYQDVVGGVTLSEAIVGHLSTPTGQPRRGWEAEHLYHLALADPDAATHALQLAYRTADADFDVPVCYRVLQTVGGQRPLLLRHRDQRDQPTDRREAITRLIQVHDALQQYYEARSAFSADLAKSAHALEREFMRVEWERIERINTTSGSSINTPEKEWIIDLTAQGGMGKTIFLQWLAARKCVPNRIPYARIDFDFTDPTVLPEAPWLILVRLAEQLNTQIVARPFSGFIERYDEYVSIARDLAAEGRAQHTGEMLDTTGEHRLARQITDDFADTLRDNVGGAVVIVLDTLEDVIRRRTTNLLAVITCLSKVHESYPNLRLVLAGRFDLRDDTKLKGFAAAFGNATRSVAIRRFDIDESVKYLVDVRGLPDGAAVHAMAECSRGLPFALSLYADEWQLGGEMTEEQVRASPNPELKYLVNRVLRRIEAADQALCWLLRYGVVPRQLTKSFARDVLLPEMESALGGGSRHDDPRRDADALHPYYVSPTGEQAPHIPIDIDDLWNKLESYTSTLSFVRADVERDTVVFHEDAVRPMRRELQRQPVFRRLHERAASYYESVARDAETTDSARWIHATRAMLFHRFQLGGVEAERAWRRALERAMAMSDLRLVFEVATELTQPEYVDDDRRPIIRDDGTPTVTIPLLREALLAKTRAAVHLGASTTAGDVDWWSEAERSLEELESLDQALHDPPAHRGTVATLRAQIDARYGDADAALRRLAEIRPTMTSRLDRLDLAVAMAGVHSTRGDAEAIDYLTEAIAMAEGTAEVPQRQLIELRQMLAAQCMVHDRHDLAAAQLLLVRDRMPRGSMARCQTTARLAEAWLCCDEPRQALGAARNARRECEAATIAMTSTTPAEERSNWLSTRAELEVIEARALAARGELAAAIARADAALATADALERLQTAGADVASAIARARARSTRGALLATLGRHNSALDDLEAARQLWAQSVKRVEQGALDLHRKVLLLLYRVGNLRMAEQHLSEAERITLPQRGEAWTALRVAASRLDLMMEGPAAAALRLQGCCSPETQRQPRIDVRIALGALATLPGNARLRPAYEAQLTRAVARISPPGAVRATISAAIPDLTPLATLTPLGDTGRAIGERIGVVYDASKMRTRALSSWSRLERARVALVLGMREDARQWLASVSSSALTRASAATVAFAHYLECEMQVPESARQSRAASLALTANPGEHMLLAGTIACRDAVRLAAEGKEEAARALAEVASALLAPSGEVAGIWSAQADGLRAELATTYDDRQHFFAEAIARYDALGQRAAAARLRERRGPPRFEESVSRERPPIVVRLDVAETEVVGEVCVERHTAGATSFDARHEKTRTLEHLRSDLEASRAQVIPYQTSRLLTDEWFTAIRDLGALFGPREVWDARLGDRRTPEIPPVDVRLEITSPIIDALPIECFTDGGDEPGFLSIDRRVGTLYRSIRAVEARRTHVTWVQRALSAVTGARIFADGIVGPQTRGAVSAFQTRVGLPQTGEADGPTSALLFDQLRRLHRGDESLRALVLAPDPELARSTGAEEEAAAGRLARVYEEAGFDTVVREGIAVAELRELCADFHPEVIHVRAPLRESPSLGGIVLDARATGMSDSASSSRGDALTPSGVTRALGQSRWPDRPIVVLDPSRGRGRTQAMHQLLLRNGFAADLFRQNTAVAVLGVGLGEPDLHARATRTIAESLARGRSLSALVGDLRAPPGPSGMLRPVTFESMLPTLGVALWAFDPSLVYLAPSSV